MIKETLLEKQNEIEQENQNSFIKQARIIYYLHFGGMSLWLKYNPSYLNTFNITPKQIGIIQTTTWSMRILVNPLWALVFDKYKTPNLILSFKYLGFPIFMGILQFGIGNDASFTQIYLCNLLALFMFEGSTAAIDGLILDRLKDRNLIGKAKVAMSFSILTIGTLYGIIASNYGFSYSILLMSLVFSCLIFYIHTTQPFYYKKRNQENDLKKALILLFKTKQILQCYIMNVIYESLFFLVDNFAFLYFVLLQVRAFGVNMTFIGICLIGQKAPEVFISYYSDVTIRTFGLQGMQILAMCVLTLRLLFYSLLTQETVHWAWAIECLHGFSLVNFQTANMLIAKKYAPEELVATSQSFMSVFAAFGYLIGGIFGSFIFDAYGGQVMYKWGSFLTFLVMVLYSIFVRHNNKKQNDEKQSENIELTQINVKN